MRMCAVHCSVCVACDGCVGKMDATATQSLLFFFLCFFFADLVILASRTSPNT